MHPLAARSLFSGSLFKSSVFHLDNPSQTEKIPIYCTHTYSLCVYTYVAALLAAHIQAHLLGWRSARREVGRSVSLKRSCQAVMGFGGQPRALLPSSGRQASQRSSRLCGTTTRAGSLTGVPKQRALQRGKNRGELPAPSGCRQDLLCDSWGQ